MKPANLIHFQNGIDTYSIEPGLFDFLPPTRGTGITRRRATDLGSKEIQSSVISVLKTCPHMSCKKDDLPKLILRHLGIVTRGTPRAEFEKHVWRAVSALKRKKVVKEYTAKNVRIKLIAPRTNPRERPNNHT